MSLPELPTPAGLRKWAVESLATLRRYYRTLRLSLRSPTSLVRHSIHVRHSGQASGRQGPISFAALSLVFASVILDATTRLVGVEEPFFRDLTYHWHHRALQSLLNVSLPLGVSAALVLCSLKFVVVGSFCIAVLRRLQPRRDPTYKDVISLLYMLPVALIAEIVTYATVNIAFRLTTGAPLVFASVVMISSIAAVLVTYGTLAVIACRVFTPPRWRRLVYAASMALLMPCLVIIMSLATYSIPVLVAVYRVSANTVRGERLLRYGDYESANLMFQRAIRNDITDYLACGARIRLVSVEARRLMAVLPKLTERPHDN